MIRKREPYVCIREQVKPSSCREIDSFREVEPPIEPCMIGASECNDKLPWILDHFMDLKVRDMLFQEIWRYHDRLMSQILLAL